MLYRGGATALVAQHEMQRRAGWAVAGQGGSMLYAARGAHFLRNIMTSSTWPQRLKSAATLSSDASNATRAKNAWCVRALERAGGARGGRWLAIAGVAWCGTMHACKHTWPTHRMHAHTGMSCSSHSVARYDWACLHTWGRCSCSHIKSLWALVNIMLTAAHRAVKAVLVGLQSWNGAARAAPSREPDIQPQNNAVVGRPGATPASRGAFRVRSGRWSTTRSPTIGAATESPTQPCSGLGARTSTEMKGSGILNERWSVAWCHASSGPAPDSGSVAAAAAERSPLPQSQLEGWGLPQAVLEPDIVV